MLNRLISQSDCTVTEDKTRDKSPYDFWINYPIYARTVSKPFIRSQTRPIGRKFAESVSNHFFRSQTRSIGRKFKFSPATEVNATHTSWIS